MTKKRERGRVRERERERDIKERWKKLSLLGLAQKDRQYANDVTIERILEVERKFLHNNKVCVEPKRQHKKNFVKT